MEVLKVFLHVAPWVASDRAATKQESVMEGVFQEGEIEVPELVGKLGRPVSPVVAGGYVLRLLLVFAVGRAFGHDKFVSVFLVFRQSGLKAGPEVAVGAAELPTRGG
jgi:hypothetical protein